MARVFLSYSNADLAWAEKLFGALRAHGFELFFDKQSLRAGQNWETQILGELNACEHLVVLWSRSAKESDWVTRERGFFDARRFVGGQRDPGRLLVHVLLDETRFAYDSDQAVSDLQEADGDADAKWQRAIRRITDALNAGDAVPVTRAIVTVTKDLVTRQEVPASEEYRCVDFDFRPPAGRTLNELLAAMNVSRAQLADCYRSEREEWRPFGGQQSVRQILETVKGQLNSAPRAAPIRWVPVEDDLLSDDPNRIDWASKKLASGLSLVVFDPVALYSQWLRGLLQYLDGCLANPHAIMVVLPVFPAPPQPRTHTDMVKQVYKRLVDHFYEELPDMEHAQCSIFTTDDADIRRLVRAALRSLSSGTRQETANAFLGMRRR